MTRPRLRRPLRYGIGRYPLWEWLLFDTERCHATLLFEPRDLWVGVYWTFDGPRSRVRAPGVRVYIGVPLLVLALAWRFDDA